MGTRTDKSAKPQTAAGFAAEVKDLLGDAWLPRIYTDRILPARTRSYHLDLTSKLPTVEIHHTLLGVELKLGSKRRLCPDLATARYLAVFARAGCSDVAVPYDITSISALADALESSWQRMLILIEHVAREKTAAFRARVKTLLVDEVRALIKEAGAGTPIPQFKQSTRQRRS